MRPDATLTRLSELASPHRSGHQCNGTWHNPQAGKRQKCPTLLSIEATAADVRQLHAQVHDAAHNPDQIDTVAEAMLSGTPLSELDPEVADGWRHVARLAVEALAADLDRDLLLEARAAAVRTRLEETR